MSTIQDSVKFSDLPEMQVSEMESDDFIAILDTSEDVLKKVHFDGSVSNGLKEGTTLGDHATAEGFNNIASGDYSHVEGLNNSAVGKCAHAEGENTTASANHAHAEGHGTIASGQASHAQGYGTVASNNYSHAGGMHTKTNNNAQTVIGKYNKYNKSEGEPNTAFEIGNGTSDVDRSNAFEVTWSGDVIASGDIQDGSGRKLSDKLDINQKGQPGGVPSLDDNGKIPQPQFDSFICGYYSYNDNKFFEDAAFTQGQEIADIEGKLYIDIPTNEAYRYQQSLGFFKVSVIYPKFEEAPSRQPIIQGEDLNTLFSKIRRYILDLGTAAFLNVGESGGVAELDNSGKVPSSQLPSYVDSVVNGYRDPVSGKFYKESTYTTEIPGEEGKIYVDLISNNTYRWSGIVFVEISESLALGETSSTAYRGDRGKIAYDFTITPKIPINPSTTPTVDGAIWIEDM